MADLTTLHYQFIKPEIGASKNTWGTKVNTNSDSLDTIVYTLRTDLTNNTNNLQASINTHTSNITALQNADTSHNNSIADLYSQMTAARNGWYNMLPIGAIVMWAWGVGAGQYPAGLAICDGRTVARTDGQGNITTPNLVGYFLRAMGSAGGSAGAWDVWTDARGNHSHYDATGAHTLTINEMPAHTHGGGVPSNAMQGAQNTGGNAMHTPRGSTDSTGGGAAHTHPIYGDGNHQHLVHTEPPWIGMVYMMRV